MGAPANVTKTGQFTERAALFLGKVSASLADTFSSLGARRAGALTRALEEVSRQIVTTEESSRSVTTLMGVGAKSCVAQGQLPTNAQRPRPKN
jgi:hypothetical protein